MRLSVSDERVAATPGIPTAVTVDVFNDGDVIDGFLLDIVGLDVVLGNGEVLSPRVDVTPPQLSIFPDTSGTVTAVVLLPQGYPSGARVAELRVRSVADASEVGVEQIHLDVERAPAVSVEPVPRAVTGGRRVIFGLVLDNTGNVPLDLALTVTDAENVLVGPPGTALRADVAPVPAPGAPGELAQPPTPPPPPFVVSLAPRERADVRLPVSAPRPVVGSPVTRIVTFAVDPGPDVPLEPLQALATFTQRPLIPRAALTIASLVLALGLWGALLLAGVDRTTDQVAEDNAALASQQHQATEDAAAAASAGVIAGTVTDTTGAPVGDATVEVAGDGAATATSLTDGAVGAFELAGLPVPGSFTITVTKEGYLGRTVPLELTPEAPRVQGIALVVGRATGSVTGTVTDAGGAPLAAVAVRATPPDGGTPLSTTTASTGSVGFYALGGLVAPGTYEVTFALAGFTDVTRTVAVPATGDAVALDVTMLAVPSASLTGTVREASLQVPACTPDSCALAGATVTVTGADGSVVASTLTAGADAPGTYAIGALTPGSYTVSVAKEGYVTQVSRVDLGAGANRFDAVLAGSPGSITGVAPGCVQVEVRLRDLSELNPPRTTQPAGSDGLFGIAELPTPGAYRVLFFGPGADGFRDIQLVDVTLGPGEARTSVTATCASSPPPD